MAADVYSDKGNINVEGQQALFVKVVFRTFFGEKLRNLHIDKGMYGCLQ